MLNLDKTALTFAIGATTYLSIKHERAIGQAFNTVALANFAADGQFLP